jgi:hypothetical protein
MKIEELSDGELENLRQGKPYLIGGTFILILFYIFYYFQESNITSSLKKCGRYYIITPKRMPDFHKLYYDSEFKGKKYEWSTSVESGDVGYIIGKQRVMSRRYWINVSCDDFKVRRVIWDVPVPDSIGKMPFDGWDKLPFGPEKF